MKPHAVHNSGSSQWHRISRLSVTKEFVPCIHYRLSDVEQFTGSSKEYV